MPSPFRPFLLNSNFCTNAAATRDYDALMAAVNHNTGNSYLSCAVLKGLLGRNYAQKAFAGINNIWQPALPRQADRINDGYSHVLLFLQDQIRDDNDFERWNELNDLIEQIRIPIVVFGLGANSFTCDDPNLHTRLAPGLVRFLQLLSDHTTELGIRGEFTADVLTKLGITNFRITGCPSYFQCGPARRVAKPTWNSDRKVIATGLFSSAEHTRLHYVLQSEPVLIKAILAGSHELEPAQVDLLHGGYPGYRECVTQAMLDDRVSVFFDPEQWTSFLASGFSLCVGTRLHGAIVALNAGIPALVTNADMRAKEVTEYFRIPLRPGICGHNFDLCELYEQLLDVDSLNDRYVTVFENYCDWLQLNGLHYVVEADPLHSKRAVPVTL
jgi:hypothetical protein